MSRLLNLEDGNILIDAGEQEKLSSPTACGYKLVPWLNWDEWEWVKVSLFSDSPEKIASAINRISTWRSRGCLPVVVDVTASLVEIQQKDQFFRREDLPSDALHSEQMLAMLYSMAILRLVNCVVEKTRKKTEISIAEAAAAIGIPRTLIDIRHESSHRDLPSLTLVRDSAVKAIHWLKAYYWEPQMELIPHQRNGSGEIRKEIKSKLRQLASSLSKVQDSQHEASPVEGKSVKKQKMKILKSLVRLYSSFSSEVLSVLLNFLLKSLDSSNLLEFAEDYQVGQDMHSAIDDWKLVITKLSKKEPELLLMLLRAILSTIETEEAIRCETGMYCLAEESRPETGNIGKLSSLFTWLVRQLNLLKPLQKKDSKARAEVSASEMNKLKTVLKELLRKCLVISLGGNKQLMESALQLAQLIGDGSLIEKISKLKLLDLSNSYASEENDFLKSCSTSLFQQNEVIRQATEKLESVKLLLAKRRTAKATDVSSNTAGRWSVVKSWNPCPIGMLPRDLGSSGCLPILDINDNGNKKSVDSSDRTQLCEDAEELSSDIYHTNVGRKREASSEVLLLDKPNIKKMKETVENCESDSEDCLLQTEFKGCLMINGVWKKVSEEELDSIKSCSMLSKLASDTLRGTMLIVRLGDKLAADSYQGM